MPIRNRLSSDEALKRLLDGNERFYSLRTEHPNRDVEGLELLAEGQSPSCVILSCSDSRVPTEIIFDMGLGDIFAIRVAGNVLGSHQMESIRFATSQLGSTLVMVMGHQDCGAVSAVHSGSCKDFPEIASMIQIDPKSTLEEAVKTNIYNVVQSVKDALYDQEQVRIVGSYFCFVTGKVQLLENA